MNMLMFNYSVMKSEGFLIWTIFHDRNTFCALSVSAHKHLFRTESSSRFDWSLNSWYNIHSFVFQMCSLSPHVTSLRSKLEETLVSYHQLNETEWNMAKKSVRYLHFSSCVCRSSLFQVDVDFSFCRRTWRCGGNVQKNSAAFCESKCSSFLQTHMKHLIDIFRLWNTVRIVRDSGSTGLESLAVKYRNWCIISIILDIKQRERWQTRPRGLWSIFAPGLTD